MKKIELVTTESGDIRIGGTRTSKESTDKDYYLIGNNGNVLFCNDSSLRLSRISELDKRLKLRDWNITGRRYTNPLGLDWNTEEVNLYYVESGTSGKSNSISKETKGVKLVHPEASEENKKKLEKEIEKLSSFDDEGKIKEIYDSMVNSEVYLYSVTKNTVDILNNSITIDVIPYNSDIYTNILDLGKLLSYLVAPGISIRIDIGIQYSKNIPEETIDPESGVVTDITYVEKLYSKETTFTGFKYSSSDNGTVTLVNNNYVENVGTDIVIEYIDNVIRVIPKSTDIDECIISNCTVTYGKL